MSPTPQELGLSLQNESGPDGWGPLPKEQAEYLNEIEQLVIKIQEAMARELEIVPGKLLLEALVVDKSGPCVHPVFRSLRSPQVYYVGGDINSGISYSGTNDDAGFLTVDWGLRIGRKRYPLCPQSGKLVVRSGKGGPGLYCRVPISKTHEFKGDMWTFWGDFVVPLGGVGELLRYTDDPGRTSVINMINMGLKRAGGVVNEG